MARATLIVMLFVSTTTLAKSDRGYKKIIVERKPASQTKADLCAKKPDDFANSMYRLGLESQTKNVQLELIELIHNQGLCDSVSSTTETVAK